jgi:uncharacterized repeat protein (TIGR03803 family)
MSYVQVGPIVCHNVSITCDSNFYGAAGDVGAYSPGTVFKITPTGVGAMLHSLSGSTGGGSAPQGEFSGAGQWLLGMDGDHDGATTRGGAYPKGALYKLITVIPVLWANELTWLARAAFPVERA